MSATPDEFLDELSDPDRAVFTQAVAFGTLLSFSVARADWAPPDDVTQWIALTETGETIKAAVLGDSETLTSPEVTMAILSVPGDVSGPYLDAARIDIDALTAWLSETYRARDLQLVWGYGHVLAETLAKNVTAHQQELDAPDSRALLENTPQAVYQIGTTLVGPFGIVESSQVRRFTPTLKAGPVPCGDPGCTALHAVRFAPTTCGVHRAEGVLQKSATDYADWIRAARPDDGTDRYLDDFNPASLPVTLANAFSLTELRCLLAEVIDAHPDSIRPYADRVETLKALMKASGESIANELDAAALLQTLLLADDTTIIEALEVLIDRRVIKIPPTEVRTMVYGPGSLRLGFFDVWMEVSQHGVCFRPRREDVSVLRLERLVRDVHPEKRDVEDLEWKLQTLVPRGADDPLDEYLRTASPAEALQRLVLHSRETIERAFRAARYGHFELPNSPLEFDRLLDRLLWKVGFAVPSHPQALPLFWQRLRTLRDVVHATPEPYGEAAQERIRAEAVNFFVSAEEVLDLALSFSTWALLEDHYGKPLLERFAFNLDDARQTMAHWLDGRPIGENDRLRIEANDKNTLFPLVAGFNALAELCTELLEQDSVTFRRPEEGLPFYAGRSDIARFPFAHTIPLIDLAPDARGQLIGELSETTATLDRAKVIDVRNRLEHRREEFPTRDEIDQSLVAWEAGVRNLEHIGCCPTVFQLARREADLYGRRKAILHNYAGESLTLAEPSALSLNDMPVPTRAQVWLRSARIAGTNESLRFSYTERSDFQKLWQEFPLSVPLDVVDRPILAPSDASDPGGVPTTEDTAETEQALTTSGPDV